MTEMNDEKENGTYAVGIDLGTTYSCIAVWRNGKVEIIPNSLNQLTTPSVVAFTETECLIGEFAREQASINPINTIYENKRIIGRKYKDDTVQDDIEHFPFKVISSNPTQSKPVFEVKYKSEQIIFHPEQIAAMILSQLKADAEKYLNGTVTNAVITVPAYFNDSQREATKDAGTIAGLNVLRCINEPTAAAIAYGHINNIDLNKNKNEERKILIIDLGGGTFDVSLLTVLDGFFEVKATAGNTHLGGEDFDNTITNYIKTQLIQEYIDKYPNIVQDIHSNASLLRELRTKCEQSKCRLSKNESSEITIEYKSNIFKYTLTRNKFEGLCNDLFISCLEPIEKVLRDSQINKNEINDIILVGGSTRIIKIKSIIKNFFNGKELYTSINPDEAIAYGASIQASILTSTNNDSNNSLQNPDYLLLDVNPLSLGLNTDNGLMCIIIKRNTPLPIEKTQIFTTLYDNQDTVLIEVYEGERTRTMNNNLLGRFCLNGIKKQLRGHTKICVTFSINENGILNVTAIDKQTQIKGNLVITNDKGRLTKQQIEQMIVSADKYKSSDNLLKGKLKSYVAMELYLYGLKKIIDIKNNINKINHKSGFKLFGKKQNKNEMNETNEIDEKDEKKIDNDLIIKLNNINDKSLKHMQDLYDTYSIWLTKNGYNCVDNKQIDQKQSELENKLGKDITNIVTDSCLISNTLSIKSSCI